MKKHIIILLPLIMCFIIGTVIAADINEAATLAANEMIEESFQSQTSPDVPVEIIYTNDKTGAKKIYELAVDESPDLIPKDAFSNDGFNYKYSEMLTQGIEVKETLWFSETVKVSSSRNDTNTILSLLPDLQEKTTENGFMGVLELEPSSISTVISGYGTSTKNITAIRIYPNLANADMQHIPKSITDNGNTLTFRNIEWKTDNVMNVDDYEIGNRYTAVVTYEGTTSSSYVKGYTTSADYSGELSKTYLDKIRYTLIFEGEEIPVEKNPSKMPWYFLTGILLLIGAGTGAFYYIKKRREQI